MKIEIVREEDRMTVKLEGRLDTANAHLFEEQVTQQVKAPGMKMVIDCSLFTYISSSGLRQLLILLKTLTAYKGSLVIKQMKPEIKEIFDMTGFSSLFRIEE